MMIPEPQMAGPSKEWNPVKPFVEHFQTSIHLQTNNALPHTKQFMSLHCLSSAFFELKQPASFAKSGLGFNLLSLVELHCKLR